MRNPQGRQPLGEPAGVAVENVAEQQLGADAKQLGPLQGGWGWGWGWGGHQKSWARLRRVSTKAPIKTAVASPSQRKRNSALATTSAREASHWVKA